MKTSSSPARKRSALATALRRLVVVPLALIVVSQTATAHSVTYAMILGSGSSWAGNAVAQWVAEVDAKDLRVVYTPNGAAQGRKDYANKSTDFGVTDSPYRGKDPSTGAIDSPLGRSFAYLPIVAGGTSFPYNVRVGGERVEDLRLSGESIAKIFTNKITNWNDPAITKDNNGRQLPSIPIIPVVRADGAGITNQFSTWMVAEYPSLWRDCNGGRAAPTDYFPLNCGETRGPQKAQTGSEGIMNFVKGQNANGAIAMEEYSYPLQAKFPVAKVLNKAGYYTLPTQYNVAVALTAAQINNDPKDPNYLTQNLDRVYVNADRRTYPLSSYVYAIIPTASNDPRMTTPKRQALVDFLKHSICEGQATIGEVGYSPLPINLVQAGFTQVNKIKKSDSKVKFDESIISDVKNCHNPTFVAGQPKKNRLAAIAPMPAACDRVGEGPCAPGVGSANRNPTKDGKVPGGTTPGSRTPGGGQNPGASTGNTPGGTSGTTPRTDAAPGDIPAGSDPAVADDLLLGAENTSGTVGSPGQVVATTLAADGAPSGPTPLKVLVVALLLATLTAPVLVARSTRRRWSR